MWEKNNSLTIWSASEYYFACGYIPYSAQNHLGAVHIKIIMLFGFKYSFCFSISEGLIISSSSLWIGSLKLELGSVT